MTVPSTPDPTRRPLRPLIGIPEPERRSRIGFWVSAAFHGAILLALILPPLVATVLMATETGGAGGPGPAGGGGGGAGGTGGPITPERLTYIRVAPMSPQAEQRPQLQPPQPEPEPPKPEPEPVDTKTPPADAPATPAVSQVSGTGGGSGHDGTAGNGPGTGGGVGSGDGTGRGSGTGPGTGGGPGTIYPPTVTNLPILPDPPRGVRPYTMVAQFEVDESGRAKLLGFNPSRNSGYNRKIREMLSEVRFRPATRYDGTPVRDTTQITAAYPH